MSKEGCSPSITRSTPDQLSVAECDNKGSKKSASTQKGIWSTNTCATGEGTDIKKCKNIRTSAQNIVDTQENNAAMTEKKSFVKSSHITDSNVNFLQRKTMLPQNATSGQKEVAICNKLAEGLNCDRKHCTSGQSHYPQIYRHSSEQQLPAPKRNRDNITWRATNIKKTKQLLTVPQKHSHIHAKLMLQVPLNGAEITAYISDPSSGSRLTYDQLDDRLKAFILPPPWEGALDACSMAEAGFVYTGQEDLVYCFSCNIKLDGWTKHMDPLLRHKEESPTCSFVRQQLQVIKGEKGKVKSVVAPSKPLNPRQTASIGQLQSSTPFSSKPIHTVVTGLDEPQSLYGTYSGSESDDYSKMHLPITVENYSSEEERIKSFIGWPLNEVIHPEQLARVGFVYTGEGSLVQCFQCGVRYRNWLKGDVPLSVHQKYNPRCTFLLTFSSKTKSKQIPNSSYNMEVSTNAENESIITLEFPKYDDQATRLQSFKYWGGVLPKEELAEAGFYMIARRDVVRCFACHVVLQDWEKSDNVIDEHQRHSPECSFLKVHLSHNVSVSHHSSLGATTSVTESSVEVLVNRLDSVQLCLSKNNPTELVKAKAALPPLPNSPGGPSRILYPPSWGSDPSHSILSKSDENVVSTESHVQRKDDYSLLASLHSTTSRNSHIVYEESSSQEVENNNNAKIGKADDVGTTANSGLCQICYDKKIECIFLPCGHARTCEECATRIKNSGKPCPYCRKSVSTTHRIYL